MARCYAEANGRVRPEAGIQTRTFSLHRILIEDLESEAKLECMEPEIAVTLKAKSLGAVEMEVQITPDQLTQERRFTFAIDQSYLEPLSSQCSRLLNSFPIRGA
jgi:hypothetical protein